MAKKEKRCHFGRDISAEIRATFGADSEALPQFCLMQLDFAGLGADEGELAQTAATVLASAELATFEGFHFPHRRREWLAGRLAVKEAVWALSADRSRALRDIEIGVDDRGKPFWASARPDDMAVHIAISHSGDTAMGLASPGPCAVDWQEVRSSLARVTAKFVRADEEGLVERCHRERLKGLAILWAGKEALRKHVALWPLLGFLESSLSDVADRGDGLLLTFQPRPERRALPARLPAVLAALAGDNALALILTGSNGPGR